jgi:hypothetical protein
MARTLSQPLQGMLKSKNIDIVSHMRSSHLVSGVAALILISVVSAVALDPEPRGQFGNQYVFVTGSMIPQRVKVKSIGTATVSPLRVIKRREIEQSGRFTTEGVLAQDPSVRVISGRAGPGT